MINYEDAVNNIYQITFSFPDKHLPINEQKHVYAKLSRKIVNPENPEDYVWEFVDDSLAKCKHLQLNYSGKIIEYEDKFDKYTGRKIAFTKLINKNFGRDIRKALWFLFLDKYGRR